MKRREFVRSTALIIGSASLTSPNWINATPIFEYAKSEGMQIEEVYKFGGFDYGLTDSQEKRAKRLHEESIVIEMMFRGHAAIDR